MKGNYELERNCSSQVRYDGSFDGNERTGIITDF